MECRACREDGYRNLASIEQGPQGIDLTPEFAWVEGAQESHQGRRSGRVQNRNRCKQRESKAYLDATPSGRGHQLN